MVPARVRDRPDTDVVMSELAASAVRVIATVPRDGQPFAEADFSGPTALLLGGEGAGLPASWLDRCDAHVTIPMTPPVESLNVAVTAGLLLYEARRQRRGSAR